MVIYKLMTEFFKQKPEDQPPLDAWQAYGRFAVDHAQLGQQICEQEAAKLKEPLAYMLDQLLTRGVAPNSTVVVTHAKPAGPIASRLRQKLNLAENPYITSPTESTLGVGWIISSSNTPFGERTITLLKDGRLVLGETDKKKDNGDRIVRPYCTDELGTGCETSGLIKLDNYPFHPVFETDKDYANVYGRTFDISPPRAKNPVSPKNPINLKTKQRLVQQTGGIIRPNSLEAKVAANLEKISNDLRINGQALGIS